MFNFRKVKPVEEGSKNKNQEDQKNYKNKVEALQKACKNFGEYLEEKVNEETKFVDIAKAFADKDTGFKDQMKKSWLLSRTSRRLNEMKKNLSKSKSKTFDPQKIDDFVKCFEFEREKLNNKGNIKRSAIDDKKVYDFFNENSKGSIREILSVKQNEAQKESNALDKKAKTVFVQANESLDASEEARDEATDVQNGMEKTRKSVRSDREIEPETKRESVKLLDGKVGELEQDKSESQQATQKLKKQQKETERIIKDENSTPRERMGSLDALRQATVANNAATGKLNGTVDKAEDAHTEVEKDIEEAKAKPFDSETETFTIRTEADFEKIKEHAREIKKIVVSGNSINSLPDKFCKTYFPRDNIIESVDLGNVTTLGKSVFSGCKKLKGIDLKNIKKIGIASFSYCSSLANVDLTNVQEIGTHAFNGCSSLTDVDLTNVQKIGDFVFEGCSSLTDINLTNVQKIGKGIFSGCSSLTDVDLKNVQKIGNGAFSGCSSLTDVDLKNVQKIGNGAFSGCSSLTTVNLANVRKIEEGAFKNCSLLGKNSVINLNSVTVINKETFKNCENMKEVHLGDNCKEILYGAFSECKQLTNINLGKVQVIENSAFIVNQYGKSLNLKNLDLTNVTEISRNAFSNYDNINDIIKTLPRNEKARKALEMNYDYENVILNGDVLTVSGYPAFHKRISYLVAEQNAVIKKMIVKGAQRLGITGSFENDELSLLEEVVLCDECRTIESFDFGTSLSKINLKNVRRIKSLSFDGTSLTTVDLSSIIKIEFSVFSDCEKLESVKLGTNCKKIGKRGFRGCIVLSKINLENVERICEKAFEGCTALETINLSSIQTIEQDAFKGCTGIKKVILPQNGEKAEEIRDIICKQTGKTAGDGKTNNTIEFINDPDQVVEKPAAAAQET